MKTTYLSRWRCSFYSEATKSAVLSPLLSAGRACAMLTGTKSRFLMSARSHAFSNPGYLSEASVAIYQPETGCLHSWWFPCLGRFFSLASFAASGSSAFASFATTLAADPIFLSDLRI